MHEELLVCRRVGLARRRVEEQRPATGLASREHGVIETPLLALSASGPPRVGDDRQLGERPAAQLVDDGATEAVEDESVLVRLRGDGEEAVTRDDGAATRRG